MFYIFKTENNIIWIVFVSFTFFKNKMMLLKKLFRVLIESACDGYYFLQP